MKAFAVIFALVAAASAGIIAPTTLVRTPALDSAVIQSDRLGGNFAYSAVEGHAYSALTPVVQNVVSPVGVSYSAHPYYYPGQVQYVVPGAPALIPGAPALVPGAPALIPGEASIVSPVAPGVIAPAVPGVFPTDFISGFLPAAKPQEEENKPEEGAAAPEVEAAEEIPANPSESVEAANPAEADVPQSDDSVSVDSN